MNSTRIRSARKDGALDLLESRVREIVREEASATAHAAFRWVHWRSWAESPRQARRLAAEGVRVTRIGRQLFGHADDLEAMASRNVVVTAAPAAANDVTDVSARVAAAFGARGGR